MPKRSPTKAQRAAELSDRALIARNCGARMAALLVPMEQCEKIIARDQTVLTDAERGAWSTLLPATWWACWRAGWRAAEAKVGNG